MNDAHIAQPAAPLSTVTVFFVVFVPFACGHYLSSLLRNVNAVLAPTLMSTIPLTPAQLGTLTSALFFAFALVQLPVGMALDRYGPRRVQLVLMLLAAAGVLMFSMGASFQQLLIARTVMGLGLGGCFMAAVKAMSIWIPPHRLPTMHGCLIAVGGLGSASATIPVRLALQFTDWRALFVDLAAAAAIIGLLIYVITPPSPRLPGRKPVTLGGICEVYRDRAFRETIAVILIPHTVFFGIQGLWMGKWLSDVAHFSDAAVANLLYVSTTGIIFGAVAVGMLAEWAGRRGIRPLSVAAAGIGVFIVVQCCMFCNVAPSHRTLAVLFTLIGTVTGLEYAIVAQNMPTALTGRAATCLNLLIFLGAFAVQAGFGLILSCWVPNAHQQYPAVAYQAAFGVLILLQVPGPAAYALRRLRAISSGRMAPRAGHPVPVRNSKDDYETGALWPAGQGKARSD